MHNHGAATLPGAGHFAEGAGYTLTFALKISCHVDVAAELEFHLSHLEEKGVQAPWLACSLAPRESVLFHQTWPKSKGWHLKRTLKLGEAWRSLTSRLAPLSLVDAPYCSWCTIKVSGYRHSNPLTRPPAHQTHAFSTLSVAKGLQAAEANTLPVRICNVTYVGL